MNLTATWARLATIRPPVHVQHHNRGHVLDELITLAVELVDALRQGPILAALALLIVLVAIQALVAQAGLGR